MPARTRRLGANLTSRSRAWSERGGRSGGDGLGGDFVAELLRAADEPATDGIAIALVEVGRAEVRADGRAGEQVVRDHHDAVADRDGGLLATRGAAKPRTEHSDDRSCSTHDRHGPSPA